MIKKFFHKIYKKTVCKILKKEKSPLNEETKRYGWKNKKDTIYVIRRPAKSVGLLSYVITTLGHIQIAIEKNYKIVVDMKNYENMYSKNKNENAWEYFFEQPSGISLKEAYRSQHVILSSDVIPKVRPSDSIDFFYNFSTRNYWKKLCKDYIRVNEEIMKCVETLNKEFFPNKEEKVLGVLCRGTDYTSLKPKNHPIQPSAKQMIEKIIELKESHCVHRIFLVTEDEKVLDEFRAVFSSDELKFLDTKRFNMVENEYLVEEMNRQNIDTRKQGVDYLIQIILLSKCNYFIAGRTSGSVGVALFTEGFEYEYYWDLGRY